MLTCLSAYDGGLTWVCQAHNALLAELTTDNQERAVLGRYSAIAMMVGSVSALISFYAWTQLPFHWYQLVCGVLAITAAICFELSYQLLSDGAAGAGGPAGAPVGGGKHEYGTVVGSPTSPGLGATGVAAALMAGLLKDLWGQTVEFARFGQTATRSRNLAAFLAFGLFQQMNCTFNTAFFPLMVGLANPCHCQPAAPPFRFGGLSIRNRRGCPPFDNIPSIRGRSSCLSSRLSRGARCRTGRRRWCCSRPSSCRMH